jgi:hypothetical protein
MYMPDSLSAMINLMNSKTAKPGLCYNITAFSFDPSQLYKTIQKYIPNLEIEYKVEELKQSIADSVPFTIDDSQGNISYIFQHFFQHKKIGAGSHTTI